MGLATSDIIVIAAYATFIFGLAQFVSREKAGHHKDSSDCFLASRSLPWWAIGFAIASPEWMAAITLLIVGKFFLPIFLKNDIVTMPQFLEQAVRHRHPHADGGVLAGA